MNVAMCTMVYVRDVERVAAFWRGLGFAEVSRETITVGGLSTTTVVLSPDPGAAARMQLFDVEFVRQVSPEVADSTPSLLFVVPDLRAWRDRIAAVTEVGEIVDNGGKEAFSFTDPEGTAFAFGAQ